MRVLLGLLLVACLVHTGLCCGKNRKKPGKPTPQTNNDIPGVNSAPYTAGADQPGDCSQLKCNLDDSQSCCWINNVPPADQLSYVVGSGQGDATVWNNKFGTATQPSGNYFYVKSLEPGTSQQTAELYSCPISCAQGDIQVQLKHWATKDTTIQVCSLSDPASAPSNCQPLPTANGNSDQVTIPGTGQAQRIAIIATGFTTPTGSFAALDDIQVTCAPCTTTSAPSSSAGTTSAGGNPPCKQIVCDFESGSPCSYTPASGGGTASENWSVHSAPYQNRLTGIPKPSNNGQKFASCYTKKKGEKSSLETAATFDKDYVVRYQYYKATEGVTFKSCCNDESNCPKLASPNVQTADYRTWKTESILCPAGTQKVLFVCENTDGASEGACGLDNIQLLQSAGSNPDDASQSAC